MNRRPLKVSGVIQRVLAGALQSEVPDANAWKINIVRITISPNLQLAKVYFSSLEGEPGRKVAEECLANHKGLLKQALAKKMRIKYQPEIRFIWDEDLQVAKNLEAILDQIKQEEQENQ